MGLMWSNQTCGGGGETQEGFEGTNFSSDSEVVFSSFISLLSFDGSETPGQSSPPR